MFVKRRGDQSSQMFVNVVAVGEEELWTGDCDWIPHKGFDIK